MELSSKQNLEWKEFNKDEDEFQASSSKFNYYIKSRDGDGAAPFRVELYTKEGSSPLLVVESAEEATSDLLRALYSYARRSASGFWDGLAVEVLKDLAEDDGLI